MSRLRRLAGRAARASGLCPPLPASPTAPAVAEPSALTPPPAPVRACDAPFTNLYFSATGRVAPCWIQLGQGNEHWSTERSILDIWRGPELEALREGLGRGEFPGACVRCRDDQEQGVSPLARVYDREPNADGWPTSLELELSNVCNLECEMCQGDLSSKIRRNREHRPPLVSPYDDSFVDQLVELMPHLEQVRFSGGEPMLHPIVHEIAARFAAERPDLRFMISTNGTVMDRRVRKLLAENAVDINVSFDSLRAHRYESIRIGAKHEKLMANLEVYRQNAAERGGIVTINTNPMRANWDEMGDFVAWCDERGFWLSYNTVLHPEEMSLRTLPPGELAIVHATLSAYELPEPKPGMEQVAEHNHRAFRELVHGQLAGWLADAEARPVPVTLRTQPV